MAVTYKDINQLTQKSSIVGTEKIEVSDTEYITPSQIAGLAGIKVYELTTTWDAFVGGSATIPSGMGDEILADISNGIEPVVNVNFTDEDGGNTFHLFNHDESGVTFRCIVGRYVREFYITSEDYYSYSLQTLELTSYRVTSVSSSSDNSHYPTAKAVYDSVKNLAPTASPALTGTPTAPTASAGTNTTQIATTAFVQAAVSGGGDTSTCVHKTGDETVGGDKTFTDNIEVVDASHILYSGASPSQGFTRGTSFNNDSGNSITFSGLSGEPKAFILSLGDGEGVSAAGVIGVIGDSTGCHGVYTTGTQHNYSNGFTTSYSNGSFTITAPSGLTFPDWDWHLIYYAGSGTLTFKTSQVQPGSGATTATFTGTGLTELPAFYAVMLESQVNNESYRRVAYYTNDGDCFENNATPKAVSFYSSQIHNTTSSFSVSYNNGLYINSGGTNAGGYFHNPGTYTLYYLMASDIGGGGSGSYSSLADELDEIKDTIGDIATILASI